MNREVRIYTHTNTHAYTYTMTQLYTYIYNHIHFYLALTCFAGGFLVAEGAMGHLPRSPSSPSRPGSHGAMDLRARSMARVSGLPRDFGGFVVHIYMYVTCI